jgi:hypothetical protein
MALAVFATRRTPKRRVRRTTILAAIQRGALPATKVGHTWVIAEHDCAAYSPLRDPREKGKAGSACPVGRWQWTVGVRRRFRRTISVILAARLGCYTDARTARSRLSYYGVAEA